MLHVARWARMGCYPCTCNSVFDPDQPVADGPVGPYVARGRWARMGCYPRVTLTLILISLLLMARWTRMLHVARWASRNGVVWTFHRTFYSEHSVLHV